MNTPETDKAERMAYSGEYMVPTEFARQLERERDEARKLACLYRDQFYAVSMPTVKPPKFSWEEGYIQ